MYGSLSPPSQENKYGNEDLKPKKKESPGGHRMTNAPFLIKLVVLSILACQIHAIDPVDVLKPFWDRTPQVCMNKWNVGTPNYRLFSNERESTIRAKEKIGNALSILPEQTGSWADPPLWQLQRLFTSGSDDESVLAIRLDNLELAGFTNKTGHWHTFKDMEHLIPGSVGLGFGNDYDSLIGGHMELAGVDLRRSSILDTLPILSNHDPYTAVDGDIKLSLAKLRVVTSETQRLTRIDQEVELGWLSTEANFMRTEDAEHVQLWNQVSETLLHWKQTGSWGGQHVKTLSKAGINNEIDAMNLVRVVCGPSPNN